MTVLTTVRSNGDGFRSIHAARPIAVGAVILVFDRKFVTTPGRYHLRIDETAFQASFHPDAHENFINHSCSPNARVNWEDLSLVASREISVGEEITFDYLTSDFDETDDHFNCRCGAPVCRGVIRGFRHLPRQEQLQLINTISPYLAKFFLSICNTPCVKYTMIHADNHASIAAMAREV